MVIDDLPDITVTIGGATVQGEQQEQVITPPRYSVLDLQTLKVTLMSSHDIPHVVSAETGRAFRALANEWISETQYDSSPIDKFMHPAHYQIIGLGMPAVPLILNEVKKMSGHWFLALRSITRSDPASEVGATTIEGIAEAWLQWGKREGLI